MINVELKGLRKSLSQEFNHNRIVDLQSVIVKVKVQDNQRNLQHSLLQE